MMLTDLTFTSNGIRCAAWHVSARSGALARPAGRPCVVMANGFGGTRDTGLLGFAEAFAHAGLDAFVFDYRGFGGGYTPPGHLGPAPAAGLRGGCRGGSAPGRRRPQPNRLVGDVIFC